MTAQCEPERLSAKEILAYDDEQLDHYLEATRRRVVVSDPENLTEEFIQRLRDRTHQPKSAPVNPQQLMARLLEAPTYEVRPAARSSSPASLASTVTVTEEEEYENAKLYEREAYQELIDSGGRPTHPIEQMEEIVKDPGELHEILTFWQTLGGGPISYNWAVFSRQRARWVEFQRIQRHVREGRFRHETDLFWARLNETWEKFAQEFPEVANGALGFPEYAQSAKERLARNGFTRLFELDLDLTKQDKLTTWIEYLNWEYMRYEDYAYNAKRRQRLHDKAWKKLVDSGVLKPGETEEVLCTFDHGLQRSADRHGAERTVDFAKRSLASAEQATVPPQQLRSRVDAARAKLDLAEDAHTRIKRRNDCISDFCQTTMDFRSSSRNAERHLKLLRWMLQQIPLIEQESNPSAGLCAERTPSKADSPSGAAACASADQASTQSPPGAAASKLSQAQPINAASSARSGTKRRRDEVGDDAHGLKRAKRDDIGKTPTRTHASPTAGSTLPVKPEDQSRSGNDHVRRTRPRTRQHGACDEPGTSAAAGPRRSARIAALSKPESKTAIALTPLAPRRRYTSRTYPHATSSGPGLRRRKPEDGSRWAFNTRMKKARRRAVVRDA